MGITCSARWRLWRDRSLRSAPIRGHDAWPSLPLVEALRRLPRRGRRPSRLAIVLGGGANLGAYEVGVIDALAQAGVQPDLLVGTSVGALNAAMWATYPGADVGQRLLRLWLSADISKIFSSHGWWLQMIRRSDHILAADGLRSLIVRGIAAGQHIEDTAIPLAVVTTDFETGERVVLREGSLLLALLASTAIPGLFHPIEMGGKMLVDGGLVANADLETAVEAGAAEALVVDVMGRPPLSRAMTAWQALDRTLMIASRRQTDLQLAAERGRIHVNLLRPRLPWLLGLRDFSHTKELFDMGRTDAEELLSKQTSLLEVHSASRTAGIAVAWPGAMSMTLDAASSPPVPPPPRVAENR
jgi:NTE family protein